VAPLGTLVAAAVCVAGVALGDIDRHFAWQAWHLATSTCILRGRRGTSVTGLGVVARLGTLVAAAVCMPGVALGDIDCGRRGTWPHRCAFCVAGVALGDIDMALDWHWRRAWALGRGSCLRGRRELGDIDRHFAWKAWHLATSTCILRSRRGTYGTGLALEARLGTLVAAAVCVTRVALDDINHHFAWQVWHLVISIFTLCGRRGTWRHRRAFCVAGVALLALDWWRAWHFGRGGRLRARRGTWRH